MGSRSCFLAGSRCQRLCVADWPRRLLHRSRPQYEVWILCPFCPRQAAGPEVKDLLYQYLHLHHLSIRTIVSATSFQDLRISSSAWELEAYLNVRVALEMSKARPVHLVATSQRVHHPCPDRQMLSYVDPVRLYCQAVACVEEKMEAIQRQILTVQKRRKAHFVLPWRSRCYRRSSGVEHQALIAPFRAASLLTDYPGVENHTVAKLKCMSYLSANSHNHFSGCCYTDNSPIREVCHHWVCVQDPVLASKEDLVPQAGEMAQEMHLALVEAVDTEDLD